MAKTLTRDDLDLEVELPCGCAVWVSTLRRHDIEECLERQSDAMAQAERLRRESAVIADPDRLCWLCGSHPERDARTGHYVPCDRERELREQEGR